MIEQRHHPAFGDSGLHELVLGVHPLHVRGADLLGAQSCGFHLEQPSHVVDVDQFGQGQAFHDRALVGDALGQTGFLEPPDRLAHRHHARPDLRGDVANAQAAPHTGAATHRQPELVVRPERLRSSEVLGAE